MTQQCPRCLSRNADGVKFCTACGNDLIPSSIQPGADTTTVSQITPASALPPGTVPPGNPTETQNSLKVIAMAVIAIMVITTALVFLQTSGTFRIFPSAAPVVTLSGTPVPEVTSYIVVETPSPELTTVIPENLTPIPTIPDTPRTSPTPTKAVVCPSDRRACDAHCRDIMTDEDNCGGCGISCSSGEICQAGLCMAECYSGETSCPDGCHDLLYDSQNCGTCGNTCPVGLACNKSVCAPALTTVIPTYLG